MDNDFAFFCPRCQHGRCYSGRATFARLHDGKMISAPDMSAYICDVCGYTEFDYTAVLVLNNLLGGKTPAKDSENGAPATYPLDESNDKSKARHPKT